MAVVMAAACPPGTWTTTHWWRLCLLKIPYFLFILRQEIHVVWNVVFLKLENGHPRCLKSTTRTMKWMNSFFWHLLAKDTILEHPQTFVYTLED